MVLLANPKIRYSKPHVQASHALAEFALKYPEQFREWGNRTLVVLKCQEDELYHTMDDLKAQGHPVAAFHEPDYDNIMTAICTYIEPAYVDRYRLL